MHKPNLTDQAKTLCNKQKKARIVCAAVHYAALLNVKKNRGKNATDGIVFMGNGLKQTK